MKEDHTFVDGVKFGVGAGVGMALFDMAVAIFGPLVVLAGLLALCFPGLFLIILGILGAVIALVVGSLALYAALLIWPYFCMVALLSGHINWTGFDSDAGLLLSTVATAVGIALNIHALDKYLLHQDQKARQLWLRTKAPKNQRLEGPKKPFVLVLKDN